MSWQIIIKCQKPEENSLLQACICCKLLASQEFLTKYKEYKPRSCVRACVRARARARARARVCVCVCACVCVCVCVCVSGALVNSPIHKTFSVCCNVAYVVSVYICYSDNTLHPALVLCPSCSPEKVGVNKKGIN